MIPNIVQLKPSIDLYNITKAYFVANGDTFSQYCRRIKVDPMYAKTCLMGVSNGKKAIALRKRIITDASRLFETNSGDVA